jgi:hypothetical protein
MKQGWHHGSKPGKEQWHETDSSSQAAARLRAFPSQFENR